MSDTQVNFINSGNELIFNQLNFRKKKKIPLRNLEELSSETRNKLQEKFDQYLDIINTDYKSIQKLEENITETLLFHKIFLNSHLPSQVDIEIARSKITEQIEHKFRRSDKFKKFQEFFLSENQVEKKRKQDKISGESIQKYVLRENTPRIRLAIDFAKEFDYTNPPIIFDKFLTELRKNIPNSVANQNIEQSNKIITELIVLHESTHIILDEKINKTYFKAAYEFEEEQYNDKSIQQFVRLIHEGFADGIATYLGSIHYPKNNVIQHYKNARNSTKNETESENKLNIYETLDVLNKINNVGQINQLNLVNYVFDIAVSNALKELEKKLNSSETFKNNLLKDLTYLESKGCFKFTENRNIIESLKNNIFEQLNNPLPINQILLNEEKVESKKQVFNNIDYILNQFRTNDSTNENKLKRYGK